MLIHTGSTTEHKPVGIEDREVTNSVTYLAIPFSHGRFYFC